jgi:hypothetical protein
LETKPAGFWIRFSSGFVDAIIIFFIWLIIQLVIGLPMFLVIIFIFVYFATLDLLDEQQANLVIPSKKSRRVQRSCDWTLYKERHNVECFFNKIKQYRRLATRFEKLACTFKAFLTLASIMIWLA